MFSCHILLSGNISSSSCPGTSGVIEFMIWFLPSRDAYYASPFVLLAINSSPCHTVRLGCLHNFVLTGYLCQGEGSIFEWMIFMSA